MIKFDLRGVPTNDRASALVHQAVGAISMCWSQVEKAGTFKSAEAAEIANDLLQALETYGCLTKTKK